jgi:hypothetical protein
MAAVEAARNYEEVLKGKYPAKAHARKVAQWILEKGGDKRGTIYLEGQKTKMLEVCCANFVPFSGTEWLSSRYEKERRSG